MAKLAFKAPLSTTAMRKMHCRAGGSDNIIAKAGVSASRKFTYDFLGGPIFRYLLRAGYAGCSWIFYDFPLGV